MYAGPNVKRNQEVPAGMVDSIRVELILTYNSASSLDLKQLGNPLVSYEEELNSNSGLWITPSYFNHSCAPNTTQLYLRDFLMIYTTRDIQKGEELTCDWLGTECYSKRQEVTSIF